MKCAPSQNKTITIFVSDSTNSKILLSKNIALPRKQFFRRQVGRCKFFILLIIQNSASIKNSL